MASSSSAVRACVRIADFVAILHSPSTIAEQPVHRHRHHPAVAVAVAVRTSPVHVAMDIIPLKTERRHETAKVDTSLMLSSIAVVRGIDVGAVERELMVPARCYCIHEQLKERVTHNRNSPKLVEIGWPNPRGSQVLSDQGTQVLWTRSKRASFVDSTNYGARIHLLVQYESFIAQIPPFVRDTRM